MEASALALAGAMLAAGLASGVHCVAMCGGIVTAFEAPRAAYPYPVVRIEMRTDWGRRLALNAGRLSTYMLAGAVAGAIGEAAYAAAALPAQETLQVLASAVMILIGLQLLTGRLLQRVETLGAPLWRRLQPLAVRALAAPGIRGGYFAGLAWGFLPCAMVYAALLAATATGGALQGALAMAAFGLGTLPFLLGAGALAARVAAWRRVAGGLLLGFGIFGLAHAEPVTEGIRRGLLCL